MHTEALANLRPSWIAFGWFIAVAVSALVILGFVALGVMSPDTSEPENLWVAIALVAGFVTGGWFVGVRTGVAPILHGLGIGLFSFVVWMIVNLLPGEATGWTTWRGLPTVQAYALIALQMVAAIVGARIGVRRRPPPVGA